jgi:hypothetical protein
MAESMEKVRLDALENLAEAARQLERILSSSGRPGIETERLHAIDKLKKRVHELDEVEGKRASVGKSEKWQEEMAGPK